MKLDHEPTLTIAAHPLAAQLDSKDLHFRSYSAVMLSMVVGKIKDRGTLKSLLGRITLAATKDRDKGVREYAGRAMRHIQQVLKPKLKPKKEPKRKTRRREQRKNPVPAKKAKRARSRANRLPRLRTQSNETSEQLKTIRQLAGHWSPS